MPSVSDASLTVAAAASLRRVMPEIVDAFQQNDDSEIVVSYGASGDLSRQVEGGAPIDAVVLAGAEPVDALSRLGLADPASRRIVATNRLVLIGPLGSPPLGFADLNRLPQGARIAIGDPRIVPAGQYARRALENLGLWEKLRDRLVYGGHVASVLAYARRGEVEAAVVYKTETRGVDRIVVLDEATGDWAPLPLVVAAVTGPGSPRAHRFVHFLAAEQSRAIFRRHGFDLPLEHEPV